MNYRHVSRPALLAGAGREATKATDEIVSLARKASAEEICWGMRWRDARRLRSLSLDRFA